MPASAIPIVSNVVATRRPGPSITANHLEVGLEATGEDQGRYMTGFDRAGDGFFDERPCWSDLTEQPLCDGAHDLEWVIRRPSDHATAQQIHRQQRT
jgi:hypothetical protein